MFASVIVPTRGRPDTLVRTLESLRAQDLTEWEAIVVDDGEGEGAAVAAGFADHRIRGIANRGTGQVDARTTGIARATGGFLCWLDDDDWWEDPHHLSVLRKTAREGAFFYRGGWIVVENDPDRPGRREPFRHTATVESLRENNTILTSSLAYPRSAHREVGPLDRELGGYCDWDLMLRLCAIGMVPCELPGPGVCYSVHDTNASAAFDAPARRLGFERFRAKHGLDVQIANHLLIHRMMRDMAAPEGWDEVDGALEREFTFDGFLPAVEFVNRVAALAESEDHHPDISISYRKVTLRWRTHSADAITDRDRELAARSAALA
jgi:pterin-4a-carbinolamine dehydratase/glycosyltransferase involved in cell wall biosynthesis